MHCWDDWLESFNVDSNGSFPRRCSYVVVVCIKSVISSPAFSVTPTNLQFEIQDLASVALAATNSYNTPHTLVVVILTCGNSELLLDMLQSCLWTSTFFLTPSNTVSRMSLKTEGPINEHKAPRTSPKMNSINLQHKYHLLNNLNTRTVHTLLHNNTHAACSNTYTAWPTTAPWLNGMLYQLWVTK